MNKILISGYTGLGNFILKTPIIKKVKEIYPEIKIDIIAGNSFGTEFVLKNSELINETYILKENASIVDKIRFCLRLRSNNYDAILLPFDANRKFLFFGSYIANIKVRIVHINVQYRIKTIFFSLMPQTIRVPLLPSRHEIDLNYDLLEAYINKPLEREYYTFLSIEYNKNILNKFNLEEKKYIVLQVGAANGARSAKKWKIENFVKLIQLLNEKYSNYKIVTVGDKGDYENDIKKLDNNDLNFINTAGLTSINDVTNIIYYSKVVVANDSGIMHMTNALKCNLIALYGPTDHTRTRPLGKKSAILYSKTDCFCKMYNFRGNETELLKKYPNCMDGISIKDVFKEIEKIIGESRC